MVDHGPILTQKKIELENWPIKGRELDEILFREGGKELAKAIPLFLNNEIKTQEQEHNQATFSKKFTKDDGLLNAEDNDYTKYLKFCAFDIWPKTYFFENNKRIIITDAELKDGKFVIKKIIPEGGKERNY
jgi:methionyl-tRNA formyltransferase